MQLCGDAHLSNFGSSPPRTARLIFDVNDFDETNPGPVRVGRQAAGHLLRAGRPRERAASQGGPGAAEAAAASYRESMATFAGKREIEIWYDRIDVDRLVGAVRESPTAKASPRPNSEAKAEATIQGAAAKARLRDAWSAIDKITEVVDGTTPVPRPSAAADPAGHRPGRRPLRSTPCSGSTARRCKTTGRSCSSATRSSTWATRWSGSAASGCSRSCVLLRGRDDDDLMVLQVKQAQASVLEAYTRKSAYSKHGHRVVTGQRLMQAASDSFLGWIDGPAGRSFYVRQLRDMKWSPDPASLNEKRIGRYALLCGHALARAHARSGDAIAISAYLGTGKAFDKAITAFAESYADQTEQDFAAFTTAIADGRSAPTKTTAARRASAPSRPPVASARPRHDTAKRPT